MKGRKPRPDELALWKEVARTTERMHPKSHVAPAALAPPAEAKIDPLPVRETASRIAPFDIGSKTKPARKDGASSKSSDHNLHMDRKTFGQMTRGKLVPEGRIDLHGMTQDQAHPALIGFVLSAHQAGKRLVLVITGKGKDMPGPDPIPRQRGVLRQKVPQWLRGGATGGIVLQVSPAHQRHGGEGALYVYLRRRR